MPHRKKVVLIVDNNPGTEVKAIERVLEAERDERSRKRFSVLNHTDPMEVIGMLRSGDGFFYDLAIVDLTFEGSKRRDSTSYDGCDVINQMKEAYPERPILCCSAFSENQYVRNTFTKSRHKPNATIAKRRYSPGQVLDIVEGLVRRFPVERD